MGTVSALLCPELRPADPDWAVFRFLLERAQAAGLRELESALKVMRFAGLQVVEKQGQYRIDCVLSAEGYPTREEWERDRERWLRPYAAQLGEWLAELSANERA